MRHARIAAAALGVVLLASCSGGHPDPSAPFPAPSEQAGSGSRLDSVSGSKTLVVCTTGDYRPFSYLDPATQQYTGIDISLVEKLAESLGARVRYVKTSWSNLMTDFLASCDIGVGGISISAERARQAFFSVATLTEGKTPITLCRNEKKFSTIESINQPGVRVITPIGGTNEKFADANFPKATITRWDDNNTIFDEIVAGRIDVMVTDASETKWVAHEKPELCAVHPDAPFNFSQKAYLLPRGDVAFQQYVDQWLTLAQHDGSYAAAEQPWFG